MNIVLVEPEIPQNTGNVARTCALTQSTLHLVRPLGFHWKIAILKEQAWIIGNMCGWSNGIAEELVRANANERFHLATTRTNITYDQVRYGSDDFLVFGKETEGLSSQIVSMFPEGHIRIPMLDIGRSLNLANSVAIVLFEALRQQGYPGLQ